MIEQVVRGYKATFRYDDIAMVSIFATYDLAETWLNDMESKWF